MYEKMYLISEAEYNLREPLGVILPTYKSPDEKALERDFKFIGATLEPKAKLLYDSILKFSRVNDKNEWYQKREDTLPVSGTNIIDLITYAVKAIGDQPYGWYLFVEFLKNNKSIPRSLLAKKVVDSLDSTITTVPLGGTPTQQPPTPESTPSIPKKKKHQPQRSFQPQAQAPTLTPQVPSPSSSYNNIIPTPAPPSPYSQILQTSPQVRQPLGEIQNISSSLAAIQHKRGKKKKRGGQTGNGLILKDQSGKGLKRYF